LIALSIRLEIARRNASGRANIVVPRSPASVTVPPASEASSQTPSTEGSVSIRGSRLVSGGQAASCSRALALIIAAPFSAIMIVGALVFVELTAGITEASTTRSASSPWLRRCARD
jgi:hypothetical protein